MNTNVGLLVEANSIRELTASELNDVHGGSYAFTVASSWASGVAGLGTGLIIGGIPGAIAGFAVGFGFSIGTAALYNIAIKPQ